MSLVKVRGVGSTLPLAAAVLLFGLSSSVLAQGNNPLITLPETGIGTLLFPGNPPVPTTGVPVADPGPGGLPNALTYNLLGPPALVAGDLILLENPAGGLSDIIRFNPAEIPLIRLASSSIRISKSAKLQSWRTSGFRQQCTRTR